MEFEKSTDNLTHASPPMVFGEVLFDCFPDGREVLGGAPFNIAWNLQAFGLSPLFISRVGDDNLGCHIQKKMVSWGMDTRGLQLDQRHPTGKVQIELTEGEPRFTILPDQAYDYISTFSGDLQTRDWSTAIARARESLSWRNLIRAIEVPSSADVKGRAQKDGRVGGGLGDG